MTELNKTKALRSRPPVHHLLHFKKVKLVSVVTVASSDVLE